MPEPDDDLEHTRQQAREEKLRKKKQKIKQSGKNIGKVYKDAVSKRKG